MEHEYDVLVSTRRYFSLTVRAENGTEAAEKARRGEWERSDEAGRDGPIGVVSVRRAELAKELVPDA